MIAAIHCAKHTYNTARKLELAYIIFTWKSLVEEPVHILQPNFCFTKTKKTILEKYFLTTKTPALKILIKYGTYDENVTDVSTNSFNCAFVNFWSVCSLTKCLHIMIFVK